MRNRKRRKARKGKPPGGRPSKLTPTVQAKLCRALAMGAHYEPACVSAGIDYSTFRKWMVAGQREVSGQFREFFEVVTRAIHKAEIEALKHWQGHMAKDYRACRDFLERRFPERWGRRERVEVTGRGGGPISLVAEAKRALAVPEIRQALNQIAKYAPPQLPGDDDRDLRP